MAGGDYIKPAANDSRISNCAGTWQGACNIDVTNWDKTNKFIYCAVAKCNTHNGCSDTLKLQWKDLNDVSPAWADLGVAGEMKQTNTCIDPTDSLCNGAKTDDAYVEDGNSALLATAAKGEFVELRVAIDPSDAEDTHEYAFQLFEVGANGLGEYAATLTIKAAPPPPPPPQTITITCPMTVQK